jgi:hypothetical protein
MLAGLDAIRLETPRLVLRELSAEDITGVQA